MKRILVVDDQPQNRKLLAQMLRALGYEAEPAADGREALAKLPLDIDLVLLDVVMPGLDGFQVTRSIRKDARFRDLPIILVTSLDSREDRLRAVEAGANDFIAKPVERSEVAVRVASQLKLKEAQDEVKRYQVELEARVEERTAQLRHAVSEMAEAQRMTHEAHLDSIRRLVLAAELRDSDTAAHVQRVSRYSELLAKALHLPPVEIEVLAYGATMHDVGKIGIPDAILLKEGDLTARERRVMQSHTLIGAKILGASPSALLQMGQVIALSHHEKWDGSGYPHGLLGEAIPLPGRICAVADVFDALTTKRPYRRALSEEEALGIMKEGRGSHFDPRLFDLFIAHLDQVRRIRQRKERARKKGRRATKA